MKYLEELLIGDCCTHSGKQYIVTGDFKKSGSRLCVCLTDGSTHWLLPDLIIDPIDIFTVDKESNIIAIKQRSNNAVDQITNIR